ncbi:MAG: helix-turn-helix domain-containing protein [Streptosporangiaceae bacterium]
MMDQGTGPTVLRILLGAQMRRLREARGITPQAAARAIRGSESKISRIELGRSAARDIDIADLLTLYGITDNDERDQMMSLATLASKHGWWRRYQDVLPTWFQAYVGLEGSARSIRSYDAHFVPGLLQTEEYAAAVIDLGEFSLAEASQLVFLRKERQSRFTASGLRLWVIIDAMALRRPVGSPATMRAQLEYLLEISDRPELTVQVTPYPSGNSYLLPGSFSILTFASPDLPDVVYMEHLTSAMYLDKPSDIEQYTAALDKVSATSTTPEQTRTFIRALLSELDEPEVTT